MYQSLLFFHNLFRWLVLASLLYAIFRACRGYYFQAAFSKTDNATRHWTATFAHIQLVIGMVLYFKSPVVAYFFDSKQARAHFEPTFFALIHSSLMLISIVLITIGSAKAKRKERDKEKFKTMLILFSIALLILFIAIPWPFSPLAGRPYFR